MWSHRSKGTEGPQAFGSALLRRWWCFQSLFLNIGGLSSQIDREGDRRHRPSSVGALRIQGATGALPGAWRWLGVDGMERWIGGQIIKSLAYCWKNISVLKFIYLLLFFERDWERERAERERESQAGSMQSVQSPTWGWNSQTVRSWPESKSRVRCLPDWAPQGPQIHMSLKLSPATFKPSLLVFYFFFSFSFVCMFQGNIYKNIKLSKYTF